MTKKEVSAIYPALAKVHEELAAIPKDQSGFNYKFRGVDQIFQSLNPLLKKNKIVIRRENLDARREFRETIDKYGKNKLISDCVWKCDYVFTSLEDGSEVRTQGFNEGSDSTGGDKASSMSTSNAFKYAMWEFFVIPTDEQKDSDQVTAQKGIAEDTKKRGSSFRKTATKGVRDEI